MHAVDSRHEPVCHCCPRPLSLLLVLAVIVVVVVVVKPVPTLIWACGTLLVAFGVSLRYMATALHPGASSPARGCSAVQERASRSGCESPRRRGAEREAGTRVIAVPVPAPRPASGNGP